MKHGMFFAPVPLLLSSCDFSSKSLDVEVIFTALVDTIMPNNKINGMNFPSASSLSIDKKVLEMKKITAQAYAQFSDAMLELEQLSLVREKKSYPELSLAKQTNLLQYLSDKTISKTSSDSTIRLILPLLIKQVLIQYYQHPDVYHKLGYQLPKFGYPDYDKPLDFGQQS